MTRRRKSRGDSLDLLGRAVVVLRFVPAAAAHGDDGGGIVVARLWLPAGKRGIW